MKSQGNRFPLKDNSSVSESKDKEMQLNNTTDDTKEYSSEQVKKVKMLVQYLDKKTSNTTTEVSKEIKSL